MTRKDELINYINTELDDASYLRTRLKVISAERGNPMIENNQIITKTYICSKEQLLDIINLQHNKDLCGHTGNDASLCEILEWWKRDK